jgi:hypothetical protein
MKNNLLVYSLLFSFILLNGCNGSTNLLGKWILEDDKNASLPMVRSMEFFKDGTGITIPINSDDLTGNGFTWTINGNRLRLTYYNGIGYVYNIEIKGTRLTEYYDDGSYSIYSKQKK